MTIKDYLSGKVKDTLLDRIDITNNKDLVSEIMSLPLRELESINDLELSKYIIALTQYVVYLRRQVNYANLKYFLNKRKFDDGLAELMLEQEGSTLKEKRERAIKNSDQLKILQENIDRHEAERILLDKIDESIIQYVNALKKEQSRRDNEKYVSRKERS